jgi:hypothetical protein
MIRPLCDTDMTWVFDRMIGDAGDDAAGLWQAGEGRFCRRCVLPRVSTWAQRSGFRILGSPRKEQVRVLTVVSVSREAME